MMWTLIIIALALLVVSLIPSAETREKIRLIESIHKNIEEDLKK